MRKKMKFLSALLLFFFTFDAVVKAQIVEPKPVGRVEVVNPKAEIVSSSERVVKGAPFSAEAVSESVQILFDGNRIVQRANTRLYRDGEGRFRRDEMPKPVALGSFVEMPQVVFILDPVLSLKIFLYPESKTARQLAFKIEKNERQKEFEKEEWDSNKAEQEYEKAAQEIAEAEQEYEKARQELEKRREQASGKDLLQLGKLKQRIENLKARLESKKQRLKKRKWSIESEKPESEKPPARSEKQAAQQSRSESTSSSSSSSSVTENEKPAKVAAESKMVVKETNPKPFQISAKPNKPNNPSLPVLSKGEAKTEALGTRRIEGVEAEGVRLTTTVAAGAIGNERPIEITYERWYSKELELIVYSKYTDPRFGEQSYRLTNIKRSEPENALFTPPADYKILTEPDKKRLVPDMKPSRITIPRKKAASL
jgi:hypothetical protein